MTAQHDELDRRIEAALRRRFAAPASLDSLAARGRPRPAVRLGPWLALAAAAAAAIVFALRLRPGAPVVPRAERIADLAAEEFPTCRLLGPLDDAPAVPALVQRPDLARLYRDMDACQRGASADECEDDEALARRLEALSLRPAAAELLHGPFLSDEWPSGQILTGNVEDQTVALVVERGATLDCCVHPHLQEGSGLHFFTWPMGDLIVTEITPHAEPRLISYLE